MLDCYRRKWNEELKGTSNNEIENENKNLKGNSVIHNTQQQQQQPQQE